MYLRSILKHGNTMIFGRLVKGIYNIIRVYVVLHYYRYYAHSECHHSFFMVKFPDPTTDFNRTGRLYFNKSEINTESHFERLSAFVCNKQQEKRGRP